MKYLFAHLLILIFFSAEAQFLGGSGDGYDSDQAVSMDNIYSGGARDGFDHAALQSMTSIFTGGSEDGYHSQSHSAGLSIYAGGKNDGYAADQHSSGISIYGGGNEDGYDLIDYNSLISIYAGGDEDGYAPADTIAHLIWTGAVGTGWNVDGNWNLGFYPRLRHQAIIPAGLTNYPMVNAGLMTIRRDINGGAYFCKGIYLAAGAEMTLRVNTTLENYGLVNIYGNLNSLSTEPEAIKIITPGKFNIRTGGSFVW